MAQQRTDKFLIAIVVGALALVATAFLLAHSQPEPAYRTDGTPEGVSHNYLLALAQRDFERAYGYISTQIEGYPESAEAFEELVLDYSWDFGIDDHDGGELQVIDTNTTGNHASVLVREIRFYSGGLFESDQTTRTFRMKLKRENGNWQIRYAGSYWSHCLTDNSAC